MEAVWSFVRLFTSTRLNGVTEQRIHPNHEGSMTFRQAAPLYQTTRYTKQHFHPKHEGSVIFRQAVPLYQTTRRHKTEDTIWIFVSVFCFNIWGILFSFVSLCYEFLISIPLHSASYYYFIFWEFLFCISSYLHFIFIYIVPNSFPSFLPSALSSSLYVSRNSLKD